jgi:hypothetical protein
MAFPEVVSTLDTLASAFAALQDRTIRGEKLSESDIVDALLADLTVGRAVSEVFLSKFIVSNSKVSLEAVQRIVGELQSKMSATLLTDPDLFVQHSRAAALLARDLRRRSTGLHLVR